MYPKTKTRRELRETVRWKGRERPLVVEILNGNLVATIKGVRAPHLPLHIGGTYLKALAADAGVPEPPPNFQRRSYKDARGVAPSLTGLSPEDAIRRSR